MSIFDGQSFLMYDVEHESSERMRLRFTAAILARAACEPNDAFGRRGDKRMRDLRDQSQRAAEAITMWQLETCQLWLLVKPKFCLAEVVVQGDKETVKRFASHYASVAKSLLEGAPAEEEDWRPKGISRAAAELKLWKPSPPRAPLRTTVDDD